MEFTPIDDLIIQNKLNSNQKDMQVLAKINQKLNMGWKMTNASCPTCQGTTLAEPKEPLMELYCPKCDKKFPSSQLQMEDQEELSEPSTQLQKAESIYYEQIYSSYRQPASLMASTPTLSKTEEDSLVYGRVTSQELSSSFQKTNDVSKKIGQKLLQGWTMLNQSCTDCMAPLMKSKKGEKLCCGCNTNYAEQKSKQKPKEKEQIKTASEEFSRTKIPQQPIKPPVIPKDDLSENKPVLNKPKQSQAETKPDIFKRIEQKSLSFLEQRIDKAISDSDTSKLTELLKLVYQIKNQFR